MSANDQKSLISNVSNDCAYLQEKIFLNLTKLPFLVKIVPIANDIKFDIIKNTVNIAEDNKDNKENIFLYNPWDKDQGINYYWTNNSFQQVYIKFFNPLSIPVNIFKIMLIFEGDKPITVPGN